jgi:hypothetical protein
VLDSLYDWLACSDSVDRADLIFALAGRESRKAYALELFSQGKGKEVLVSVGRYEMRRFAALSWPASLDLVQLVAALPPPQRHLFVHHADGRSETHFVRRGRFGTWSEIRALAIWLQARPDVVSLLIVSSAAHLRRVRLCCEAMLPRSVRFRLSSVNADGPYLTRDRWWHNSETRDIVVFELPKLLLYWVLLRFRS